MKYFIVFRNVSRTIQRSYFICTYLKHMLRNKKNWNYLNYLCKNDIISFYKGCSILVFPHLKKINFDMVAKNRTTSILNSCILYGVVFKLHYNLVWGIRIMCVLTYILCFIHFSKLSYVRTFEYMPQSFRIQNSLLISNNFPQFGPKKILTLIYIF